MIVLDAGVLIAHLDPADAFHTRAVAFLEDHATASLAMNVVTVAECLVRPTHAGAADAVTRAIDRLAIRQIGIDAGEAQDLAAVRASIRLRMPDAIVLHTAQQLRAELVTTDAALARAASGRGVIAHPL